jgi:hypothetical protein
MCRRIQCRKCGRPSYSGCGAHVEQVLRDVPPADRCHCREAKAADAKPAGGTGRRSWLSKLLSK